MAWSPSLYGSASGASAGTASPGYGSYGFNTTQVDQMNNYVSMDPNTSLHNVANGIYPGGPNESALSGGTFNASGDYAPAGITPASNDNAASLPYGSDGFGNQQTDTSFFNTNQSGTMLPGYAGGDQGLGSQFNNAASPSYGSDNNSGFGSLGGSSNSVVATPGMGSYGENSTGDPAGALTIHGNQPATSTQDGNAFSSGAASGDDTAPMGIPVDVPTAVVTGDNQLSIQSQSNTKAINATSKADTDALNKTSTANTKTATQTAQTIWSSMFATLTDGAMRAALIAVGIVVLAGALWVVASENGAVASPAEVFRKVKRAAPKFALT